MTTADKIPVLCTLARHHKGDHREAVVPASKPCGEVVQYVERVAEEGCPPVAPVEVATDGATLLDGAEPFDPVAHAEAVAVASIDAIRQPHDGPGAEELPGAPPPPTPPAPVPAEPPALADLIEAAEVADDWVTNARIEKERADAELGKAIASQERRRSAVAQRAGKGALVMVGSVLFRSVPPRKPKGGEVAEGAMWKLEPVEVKK